MPTRTSTRRTNDEADLSNHPPVVRENPEEFGKPRRPAKPLVLVLEEPTGSTHTLISALEAGGYRVQTLFEEARAVAKILSAMHRHVLLLTAHDSSFPVRVPLIVQLLRRQGYEWPIAYCVKGKVLPKTQFSYEDLSVDDVWSIPARFRSSALAALGWVEEQIDLSKSGTTIVEF